MAIGHYVCQWCNMKAERCPDGPTFCLNCSHRADCGCDVCDCLMCEGKRAKAVAETPYVRLGRFRGLFDVDGSTIKKPVLAFRSTQTSATVHVEDTDRPGWWLDVQMTAGALVTLLEYIYVQTEWNKAECDAFFRLVRETLEV